MSQKILERLNQKPLSLKEEIRFFRSFIIGIIGKDQEGEYKPEFIYKILQSAKEKGNFVFKNKKDFLRQIKKT